MRPIPSQSTASAISGLWFVFSRSETAIALWVSSITGKEEVYVGGKLVARRRTIGFTSSYAVTVGSVAYTLCLKTRNVRKGIFECTLLNDGQVIDGYVTEYVSTNSIANRVLTAAAVSVALSLYYLYSWPAWVPITAMLGIVAISAWKGRASGYVVRALAR